MTEIWLPIVHSFATSMKSHPLAVAALVNNHATKVIPKMGKTTYHTTTAIEDGLRGKWP